jgi:hypothetical protein
MELKLLDFKELPTFPAGTGIEFFDGKVYIIGDDATNILVKSKKWKLEKKIHLFEPASHKIPRLIKSDLEATTVVQSGKKSKLLMLGSGSREQYRNKAVLLDFESSETEEFDLNIFYRRLKTCGIGNLRIEGAATVEDNILLSNRSDKENFSNYVIVTSNEFWKNQDKAEIQLLQIVFEQPEGSFAGVSGLTYSPTNDWLLFTTSGLEPLDNGKIGDSYLGIIENAARKIGRKKLKVNSLINLPEAVESFKGNRVESLCIQRDRERNLKLHLLSGNEAGKGCLFKIRLKAR